MPRTSRPSPAPVSRRKAAAARKVGKTERWLNLLAFLCDRRYPVTREQIFTEVEDYRTGWLKGDATSQESVRRKFERDKRELRDLGVVLKPEPRKIDAEHVTGDVEGYRLRPRDLYLPYLDLTSGPLTRTPAYHLPSVALKPDEFSVLRRAAEQVLALGDGPLGISAASALRKLSFDLPGTAPGDGEMVLTAPVGPAFDRIFGVLRQGVEERQAVRCVYYAIGRDQEDERVIEPYGLMLTWGTWYCIARSRERDAIRVFRLDRMRSAELITGEAGAFKLPAGFSVQQYLDRAPWELSDNDPVPVRVRIGFPHSRWVIAEGLGTVVEPVDAAGGAVLEFAVRTPDPFIRWLLPFGNQADILAPDELAAQLRDQRARIQALYR
ncbi:MAG TPA: WYL domain-containing protein [Gemmatimonadales bacterium]|nr:WYL domain-containing protein [Gemmatimonadales bacterium]